MKIDHYPYRFRQFFAALYARPDDVDKEAARRILTPPHMELFTEMQASEQLHSLMVMKRLQTGDEGQDSLIQDDLLVAALLHDVGKSRYPLRLWERVMIVLVRYIFPGLLSKWGKGEPNGWRRAFVVAENHPHWGAKMAEAAGASPLTVELICRHQNFSSLEGTTLEDELLHKLQIADNQS